MNHTAATLGLGSATLCRHPSWTKGGDCAKGIIHRRRCFARKTRASFSDATGSTSSDAPKPSSSSSSASARDEEDDEAEAEEWRVHARDRRDVLEWYTISEGMVDDEGFKREVAAERAKQTLERISRFAGKRITEGIGGGESFDTPRHLHTSSFVLSARAANFFAFLFVIFFINVEVQKRETEKKTKKREEDRAGRGGKVCFFLRFSSCLSKRFRLFFNDVLSVLNARLRD